MILLFPPNLSLSGGYDYAGDLLEVPVNENGFILHRNSFLHTSPETSMFD